MKRRYTYDDGRPYEWTERVRASYQPDHLTVREVAEWFAFLGLAFFIFVALCAVEPV